jgi:phosphopantetheinyl transferase (holo-ACP synthase)
VAVGNDLVDLSDPFARRNGLCRRYASRVLGPRELKWWENSGDPALLLWTCWSVKEAVFKAFGKLAGPIPFLPKTIAVADPPGEGAPEIRGTADTPWGRAVFRSLRRMDHIHTLCAPAWEDVLDETRWRVRKTASGGDGSLDVRRAAGRALARHLGVQEEEIRILRDRGDGTSPAPRVFLGERELPADLSLSHDGRYVAYAFRTAVRRRDLPRGFSARNRAPMV